MNKYWKDLIILLATIAICALAARALNSGETLAEYAEKNPGIAYSHSTTAATEEIE